MDNDIKIGIIYGCESDEKEISIRSYNTLSNIIKECGYTVIGIQADEFLIDNLMKIKKEMSENALEYKFFNVCHGGLGENGSVQGILEYLKIKYIGSGIIASSICMDKNICKNYLKGIGITTPNGFIVNIESADDLKKHFNAIQTPLIVKPVDGGSSIDVYAINKYEDIDEIQIQRPGKFLVEQLIKGQEISVFVVNTNAVGLSVVCDIKGIFTYDDKYDLEKHASLKIIQAHEVNIRSYSLAMLIAEKACKSLECNFMARVDFIIDDQMNYPYLLEINTQPGITEYSSFNQLFNKMKGYKQIFINMINS